MKRIKLLAPLLLLGHITFSQKPTTVNEYATVDKIALQIPEQSTSTTDAIASYISSKFTSDNEKVRAAFIWVASNVEYDVKNMYSLNFYEKAEDKISRTLMLRKGVCTDYATLFSEICKKAGIKSYVIEGYTKQNGVADHIGHAWNGVKIDGTWYLFDPTWGAGYASNGKFTRKINNSHFKADPARFIKSHMPFDYLWQFLNYPVSSQQFLQGYIAIDKSKPYFSYPDSIAAYENMDNIDQLSSAASRIERNGVKTDIVFERLQHLKLQIENTRQNEAVNLYNSATADANKGVNNFNDYINYKNKQFTPTKADAQIQQMLANAASNIESAKTKIAQIKGPDENITPMTSQLKEMIAQLEGRVNEEQTWLSTYMKKGKLARRQMFYQTKVTWFGIPLN